MLGGDRTEVWGSSEHGQLGIGSLPTEVGRRPGQAGQGRSGLIYGALYLYSYNIYIYIHGT